MWYQESLCPLRVKHRSANLWENGGREEEEAKVSRTQQNADLILRIGAPMVSFAYQG